MNGPLDYFVKYSEVKDDFVGGKVPVSFELQYLIDKLSITICEKFKLKNIINFNAKNTFNRTSFVKELLANGLAEFVGVTTDMCRIASDYYDENNEFVSLNNSIVKIKDLNVFVISLRISDIRGNRIDNIIHMSETEDDILKYNEIVAKIEKEHDKNNIWHLSETNNSLLNLDATQKSKEVIDSDDVFIDDNIKQELFMMIEQFFATENNFYIENNIPYKRGVLLHGEPGNGKTTLLKYITSILTNKIYFWNIGEYTRSESISTVFTAVKSSSPAILFIEDMDNIPNAAKSAFLNNLDGVNASNGIFIIATTNHPDRIDKALINRPGRFDRLYEIKNPDIDIRTKFFNKKGIQKFITDADFEYLITKSQGLSLANLNEIYTTVALYKHYGKEKSISSIIDEMKSVKSKQEKGNFSSDNDKGSVGFI